MKSIITIVLSLFLFAGASARDKGVWSLEQCIEHARQHNLVIKQRALNAQYSENQYQQRKLNLYPSVNGSSSFTTNMGRVRNDVNYEIIDVTTRVFNLGASASLPVFEGFTRRNSIEQGLVDWEAALKEVEKTENDIALNITALYMQILFDKELLAAGRHQLELVNMQVDRSEKLVRAGSLPEGNLLEMRALAARELSNVTRLENNLTLSLLDLAQALDLEDAENFDIVTPEIPEISGSELVAVSSVYDYAVNTLPQISLAQLRLESSEMDVKIAKGYLYPRVSLTAGLGTNVSKYKQEPNFDFERKFKDNAFRYYGVNVTIPIFNGLQARMGVKNASLGVINAQHELNRQKQVLRKEIQQAVADAEAAFRQYMAGQSAVASYEESFRYTEQRYNVGLVNSVDYNVSKTEYMKAESDFIQAKYAYLLRLKILDFYQGRPLVL